MQGLSQRWAEYCNGTKRETTVVCVESVAVAVEKPESMNIALMARASFSLRWQPQDGGRSRWVPRPVKRWCSRGGHGQSSGRKGQGRRKGGGIAVLRAELTLSTTVFWN